MNIFKTMALAMMMPAMMLTTACSNEDDAINNGDNKKGYPLQVTVNVTREGDKATTRATYNDGTKKLGFSTGDKLFVSGTHASAGQFAGALDYVPATGKFSGTIYTQNDYDGTADALFSAAYSRRAFLLPNGYDSYNFLSISNNNTPDVAYDDVVSASIANAFVASETAKATGVEQLSWEQAYTYSSGFALAPANAVLNFTISGLEAGAKTVTLITKYSGGDDDKTVTGSVTPNASGVATFAIGVPNNLVIKNVANNLTIGSSNFTLPGNTALAAGKIYNITRGTGATVNLSTKNAAYTAQNGETLTGTLGANVKISIADGATVILNNVTINGVSDSNYEWAGITCLGDATIILSGTNTVKGFNDNYPGIQAAADKTLIINGTGSLTASSYSWAAAIGGGYNIACGNIEIQGGTITATTGERCAGIGGGYNASCGNITISGGTVTATGGMNAAGIGGGRGLNDSNKSSCGTIEITTGVTKVTATKGSNADNSIGAGYYGTCGTVTIGGNVGAITTSPYTYQPE